METTKNLGFDIDEVLARTIDYILDFLNSEFGIDYWTPEHFTVYEFEHTNFVGDEKFNRMISKRLLSEVTSKRFVETVKHYNDAVKYIRKYKDDGHRIYFITDRSRLLYDSTLKWLKAHNIPFDGLYHTGPKTSKGYIGKTINLDFFIDDKLDNLESMIMFKKDWKKGLFLMDQPYNRNIDEDYFTRVHTWQEVDGYVRG